MRIKASHHLVDQQIVRVTLLYIYLLWTVTMFYVLCGGGYSELATLAINEQFEESKVIVIS